MTMITALAEVDEQFTGPLKTPTLDRMRAFSGWPKKNIHTDVDSARSCGLPAPIASGAMLQGYLTDMMLGLFGDDWLYHGKMSVTFLKPAYAGDAVQLMAIVKSRTIEGSRAKFELEVWGENQHGEKVFTGFCRGLVPFER